MKKFITSITILLSAFIFITGCSKDDATPDPLNPVSQDSMLSELIVLDELNGSIDSVAWLKLLYDANNRVNTIQGYFYDNGSWVLESSSQYFYNGNDTLPSRVNEGPGLTRYFFYNNAGFAVRDSFVESSTYYVRAEREIPQGIEYRSSEFSSGTLSTYVDTLVQVKSGGLITRETSLLSGDRVDYEYDMNPNPFYRFGEFRKLSMYYYGFILQGSNGNNLKRVLYTSPFGNEIISFAYTYNTIGLPVKITETNPATPGEAYHYILKYRGRN